MIEAPERRPGKPDGVHRRFSIDISLDCSVHHITPCFSDPQFCGIPKTRTFSLALRRYLQQIPLCTLKTVQHCSLTRRSTRPRWQVLRVALVQKGPLQVHTDKLSDSYSLQSFVLVRYSIPRLVKVFHTFHHRFGALVLSVIGHPILRLEQ